MSEGRGPLGGQDDARRVVDDSPMTQQSGGKAAQDVAEKAQEKAMEYGEKAQERVETGKDSAAESLQGVAEKVREKVGGDGMAGQAGEKVADTMEKTAGYLREHETSEIVDDVERYVREHPMQALAGAVLGGFVIGRMLR